MTDHVSAFAISVPVHDADAERSLLGSICLSETAFIECQGIVRPEHFYNVAHRLIFDALVRMDRAGIRPDAVTLRAELERAGTLDEVGGDEVLIRILDAVPHSAHARHYAEIIRDRWQERELRGLCRETLADDRRDRSIADRVGDLESGCLRILEAALPSGPVSTADAMVALNDRWQTGASIGEPTGFAELDKLIGGLRPGSVTVIAARPGMGKSALAGCIAQNFAKRSEPTLICSLEMSRAEIAQRLLALQTGTSFKRLEQPDTLDELDREIVFDAMQELSELPLSIDDSAGMTLQHIAAVTRLQRKKHGLKLGIIDYLQLIRPTDPKVIREQQVAEISRELKALARDLGIPLLLLAQLNRSVENRENRTPRLSDLRESGSIEQDADAVVFVYQPDDDEPGLRELVVAKNRHGPTGRVSVQWNGQLMRFRDMEEPAVGF